MTKKVIRKIMNNSDCSDIDEFLREIKKEQTPAQILANAIGVSEKKAKRIYNKFINNIIQSMFPGYKKCQKK